jgi:hypothetical protein
MHHGGEHVVDPVPPLMVARRQRKKEKGVESHYSISNVYNSDQKTH